MGNRRSLPRLLLGRTHSRTLVGRGMSASEKLKALLHDAETGGRGFDNDIHGEPLLLALPQIVALTLWAEQTIKNFEEYGEVSFIPLIDSLEELDKALS